MKENTRNVVAKKFPLFHPLSRRFHIILLLMLGFSCTSFMRMHMAITMTCMINSTALAIDDVIETRNLTVEEIEAVSNGECVAGSNSKRVVVDYGGDLVWDAHSQNLIFSGTFWGSIFTVLPSMFIIQRFPPRIVMQAAVGMYIISTLCTPFLAENFGPFSVFLARVFMGLGEGLVLPSINAIVANWFPSTERSTAVSIFTTGNQLAAAFGNPIAASLCASSLGWPSIFYVVGITSTIWSILWFLTSTNQPSKCKVMKKAEREYLAQTVATRSSKNQRSQRVPYRKILSSPAFLAQLQCHFVVNANLTLFQIYLPSYLKDVLHLGIIANGTFTAFPNALNFISKIFWGIGIDRAKERKMIKSTVAVKLSHGIASYGVASSLIAVAYLLDCSNPTTAFFVFCFMYSTMGTFVSGFYTSLLSLAPRYTATMSSMSVFAAMLGRLCTPAIVELIKKHGTLEEWQVLFVSMSVMAFISGTIFILFGSGEQQEWGMEDEPKELKNLEQSQPLEKCADETSETSEVEILKRRIREDSLCV